MTKKCIDQLGHFTAKLMPLIESEIEKLQFSSSENDIDEKRKVAETLGKIASLLRQLAQLKKEEDIKNNEEVSALDQEIIERFLEKRR